MTVIILESLLCLPGGNGLNDLRRLNEPYCNFNPTQHTIQLMWKHCILLLISLHLLCQRSGFYYDGTYIMLMANCARECLIVACYCQVYVNNEFLMIILTKRKQFNGSKEDDWNNYHQHCPSFTFSAVVLPDINGAYCAYCDIRYATYSITTTSHDSEILSILPAVWQCIQQLSKTTMETSQGRQFPDNIFKCIYLNNGSDNGLAPARRQAIIWTNDGLGWWRIYASLDLNVLSLGLEVTSGNQAIDLSLCLRTVVWSVNTEI